jgi:hypothetical protein
MKFNSLADFLGSLKVAGTICAKYFDQNLMKMMRRIQPVNYPPVNEHEIVNFNG